MFYNVLRCFFNVLQSFTMICNVLQCVSMVYNVLQCFTMSIKVLCAMFCHILQCFTMFWWLISLSPVLTLVLNSLGPFRRNKSSMVPMSIFVNLFVNISHFFQYLPIYLSIFVNIFVNIWEHSGGINLASYRCQ